MTLHELETNQKLKYWYDHITAQQASELSVANYCKVNHLTQSVFYDYKKKIKQLICDDINSSNNSSAIVPFIAVPKTVQTTSNDKTTFTKGGITITCDSSVSFDEVAPLLKVLLC